MRNFEFEHDGKRLWYARSVVTVAFIFATGEDGRPCILANKRGTGVHASGLWNVPCGHLDFDEDCRECAVRETYEECGVMVPCGELRLYATNSRPDGTETQSVSFLYYATLAGTTRDYPTSTAHMERDEVDEIRWIPTDEIDGYEWAFGHEKRIRQIFAHIFGD